MQRVKLQSGINHMAQKKDFVVAGVITYVFLLFFFFMAQDGISFHSPCSYDEVCIRFCCYDKSLCKENLIRDAFNVSLITTTWWKGENESTKDEYKILLGAPACKAQLVKNSTESGWRIDIVRCTSLFHFKH